MLLSVYLNIESVNLDDRNETVVPVVSFIAPNLINKAGKQSEFVLQDVKYNLRIDLLISVNNEISETNHRRVNFKIFYNAYSF